MSRTRNERRTSAAAKICSVHQILRDALEYSRLISPASCPCKNFPSPLRLPPLQVTSLWCERPHCFTGLTLPRGLSPRPKALPTLGVHTPAHHLLWQWSFKGAQPAHSFWCFLAAPTECILAAPVWSAKLKPSPLQKKVASPWSHQCPFFWQLPHRYWLAEPLTHPALLGAHTLLST